MSNRPKITTSDVAPQISHDIDLSSNIATEDIERPDLAIATDTSMDDPNTNKYVRDLAFMEDIVEFVVGKTKDKNEPDPIIAGVNGISRVIKRDAVQRLPRKFLNALISTTTDVDTVEFVDEKGLQQTRIQTVTTPALQIQLLSDPRGRDGIEWFRKAYYSGGY